MLRPLERGACFPLLNNPASGESSSEGEAMDHG